MSEEGHPFLAGFQLVPAFKELVDAAPESEKINGYVIESESGMFLTEGLYWFDHKSPDLAWVHPLHAVQTIREVNQGWTIRPMRKYPASWSLQTGTKILGPSSPFLDGLDK